MQCQARDRRWIVSGVAVHCVPEHRMAEIREVHPDLVSAAAPERRFHERRRAQPLDRCEGSRRRAPAVSRAEGGAPSIGARASDVAVDGHRGCKVAGGERQVPPLDPMCDELRVQVLGGLVRECKDHDAGGFAVEAMDDEDAPVLSRHPLHGSPHPSQNGVRFLVEGGVDNDAGRLFHHHDVTVEVEHTNGPCVRGAPAPRQVRVVLDDVVGVHERSGVRHHRAIDQHVADLDLVASTRERAPEQELHAPGQTQGPVHKGRVAPRPRFTSSRQRARVAP